MKYLFLFSYFSIYCMCQPKRLRANGRLLSQMHSPRHPCGTPSNIAVISDTTHQFCIGKSQKIQGNTIAVYIYEKPHVLPTFTIIKKVCCILLHKQIKNFANV